MKRKVSALNVTCLACCLIMFGCATRPAEVLVQKNPMEKGLDDTFAAIDSGDSKTLFKLVAESDRTRAELTEEKLSKLLALYKRETQGSTAGPLAISGDTHFGNAWVVLRKNEREIASVLVCYVTEPGKERGAAVTYGIISAICMARAHQNDNRLNSTSELFRSIGAGLPTMEPELKAIGFTKVCGPNPVQPCETLDEFRKRCERIAKSKP